MKYLTVTAPIPLLLLHLLLQDLSTFQVTQSVGFFSEVKIDGIMTREAIDREALESHTETKKFPQKKSVRERERGNVCRDRSERVNRSRATTQRISALELSQGGAKIFSRVVPTHKSRSGPSSLSLFRRRWRLSVNHANPPR